MVAVDLDGSYQVAFFNKFSKKNEVFSFKIWDGKVSRISRPSTYHYNYELAADKSNYETWNAESLTAVARNYDTIILCVFNEHSMSIAERLRWMGKRVVIMNILSPLPVLNNHWADTVICAWMCLCIDVFVCLCKTTNVDLYICDFVLLCNCAFVELCFCGIMCDFMC